MITEKKEIKRYEKLVKDLLLKIPKEQIKEVFEQEYCDIDYDFIGFIETYFHLSKIIPKHFDVIDLGCAYNPQCYYFTKHKSYTGVDLGILPVYQPCEKKIEFKQFKSLNCKLIHKHINTFLEEDAENYEKNTTFVICNYSTQNQKILEKISKIFKNIYMFYPSTNFRIYDMLQKEKIKMT